MDCSKNNRVALVEEAVMDLPIEDTFVIADKQFYVNSFYGICRMKRDENSDIHLKIHSFPV